MAPSSAKTAVNLMMKKIAIVHPFLGTAAGSGSLFKCLKIIEALRGYYDLYLITGAPQVDFAALNDIWATDIQPGDIRIVRIPLFLPRYIRHFMAFRHSLVGRYCQIHAREYDVMLSAYNPYDFGVKGIQFIGDFLFSPKLRAILHPMPDDREFSWFYKSSLWRDLYMKLGRCLYAATEEGLWQNLTIANSLWTRDLLLKNFGVDSIVVYPPVANVESRIPWSNKEEGFVTISNLVPFKQVERSIHIVQAIRNHGFNVHLHLVGEILDQVYANKILGLCQGNSDWCFFEGPLYNQDKMRLVDGHKYGIHSAQVEGFGIAVAEMVKAGCIVWVAEGGGQTEIVESELLTFKSEEEAVIKILAIFQDMTQQEQLRRLLLQRSQAFTLEKFFSDLRRIVADFIIGESP
jgi:glycosyltransferase involved in cell wall biosynthesis